MSKEKIEAVLKYTEWMLEMLSESTGDNPALQCTVENMSSHDILKICLDCVEVGAMK